MMDPEYDSTTDSEYECFACGTVVEAKKNPDSCPDCGERMRNRLFPIE